ncbi:MAG: glycosyltransferase family 4 protein [Blastochloris viridis]|uniref:Glycosyltransferase family 4 protein n=1 Tax=Blastochloris viridis TaxID=1079 RepID=A0A6N4R902_BLAVI|nr:MAG: glycosyltransferase family 4 protein [Blastochloris viridis]
MRILHACLTTEFSGPEMYCASLARAQAQAGDEVRVVVRTTGFVPRWREETGKAITLALPTWLPQYFETFALRHLIKGFEPDVVHTHQNIADKKAGTAARKRKVPWVTTVHRWKPESMKASDAAVCIAGWQRKEILADGYTGILRTVWNWLPLQKPASNESIEALRATWHASAKTVVFGSVGRLHGQKGMDVLIKAFLMAYPDPEADVRLVIVGEGPDRAKLEALKGPDRRIVLAGYVPEMAAYYEAFDAYVSASRYEPFGLTILEAMSHGCQLVCTRTEGPSEFLSEPSSKGQVIWAERGNVESLAAALPMAQVQGREHITYNLQPFSVNRALREIADIYEELLKTKK